MYGEVLFYDEVTRLSGLVSGHLLNLEPYGKIMIVLFHLTDIFEISFPFL